MGQHPKVLADVLDEIDGVLRGGPPSLMHLPKLVLVDRVLKESMRVLAPIPRSLGLMGIRERARQLGGTVSLSRNGSHGAIVALRLPLDT